MRNFLKLDITAPAAGLYAEILRHGESLWNQDRLRTTHEGTPHGQVSDILLRFNKMQETRQAALDDCETYPREAWDVLVLAREVTLDLMRHVGGVRLGRVMLTSLPPGGIITPHRDMGTPATYYQRYHVVVAQGAGINWFRCEDEVVHMQPGEVWLVNNDVEHEVRNETNGARIHLIVDIREDDV